MNAMWQLWENRFSKATCEQIISLTSLLPEQQAVIGSNEENVKTEPTMRRSKVRWLSGAMPDFKDFYLDVVEGLSFWQLLAQIGIILSLQINLIVLVHSYILYLY